MKDGLDRALLAPRLYVLLWLSADCGIGTTEGQDLRDRAQSQTAARAGQPGVNAWGGSQLGQMSHRQWLPKPRCAHLLKGRTALTCLPASHVGETGVRGWDACVKARGSVAWGGWTGTPCGNARLQPAAGGLCGADRRAQLHPVFLHSCQPTPEVRKQSPGGRFHVGTKASRDCHCAGGSENEQRVLRVHESFTVFPTMV